MGAGTTTQDRISWQTLHYLNEVADGEYQVACCLEMEPPIQDPIYAYPSSKVRVKNGWVTQSDAAIAVAEAVEEVGGKYDTIVGLALSQGKLQFVVIWEHNSAGEVQSDRLS